MERSPVGVLSDIHDALENLDRTLDLFRTEGVDRILFCGDFCSPIPARVLGGWHGRVDCVFGNGDGDRFGILRAASSLPALELHGEHADLAFSGRRLALTHFPLYGQALARTGDYDAVFSGHTHERHWERFGRCLWANPGEVMGWKGPPSAFLWDPVENEGRYVEP